MTFGDSTLLLLGGIFTGIAGCITAYSTLVRARRDSKDHGVCRVALREAREEAETLAQELHTFKMLAPGQPLDLLDDHGATPLP